MDVNLIFLVFFRFKSFVNISRLVLTVQKFYVEFYFCVDFDLRVLPCVVREIGKKIFIVLGPLMKDALFLIPFWNSKENDWKT